MNRHLRLLPVTMLAAFLLLGLKVGEVLRDGRMLVLTFTSEAEAQQTPAPPAAPSGAGKPADTTDAAAKKETDPKVNAPSTSTGGDDEEEEDTQPKHELSQVEIDLLQSLAKRRQEIDDWAKQVQLKENMLIATEQRLNEKIDTLQRMKKELEALLAQYNEQEDTKIRSLVKIYENMKPKDAARIFEELDMPVLLTVVDRMSERKVAPILAGMSPEKAKDVTVQLAEQRKLQKPRAGAAAAAAANTPSSASDNAASPPADTGNAGAAGGNPSGGGTATPAAPSGAGAPPADTSTPTASPAGAAATTPQATR